MRLPLLLAGVVLLAVFVLSAGLARNNPYFPFDLALTRWLQALVAGRADWLFGSIEALNGPTQTLVSILVLLLVVVLNPRTIVFAVLAALTGPIYFIVNGVIARPRPSAALVDVAEHLAGSSFPSGHSTFALTYAALLVLCVAGKYFSRRWFTVSAALGALFVLVFSTSRVVTGGHWPSDVIGGWLLAGGWICTVLSVRFVGDPVLDWLGDPERAWQARHPSLPRTWESRRLIVRRVLYTPIVQAFERFGYVVRGLLWGLMGAFAITSAFGISRALDLYGAVLVLESNPLRGAVAFLATVGLAGYALWGYFRTFDDPLQRGSDAEGMLARLGFLSSALSYTLLAVFAAEIGLTGAEAASRSASQARLVASVVTLLHGEGLIDLIAGVFIVIALGQFLDAWRAPFRRDVLIPDAPRGRAWLVWNWLGRIGLVSRGVLFMLSGGLLLFAALTGSSWSVSFTRAFDSVRGFPAGSVLLTLLGLGLIALGLHSFGGARWIRMRPPVLSSWR